MLVGQRQPANGENLPVPHQSHTNGNGTLQSTGSSSGRSRNGHNGAAGQYYSSPSSDGSGRSTGMGGATSAGGGGGSVLTKSQISAPIPTTR